MKNVFFFFILLLTGLLPKAQTALQNQVDPKKYKPYEVRIKNSSIKNESSYYFKIIDRRDDTTRLGFMKDGDQQIYFHFKEPASAALFSKINGDKQVYKDTLVVVLHKLWVFESFLPRKQKIIQWSDRDYKIKCFGRIEADIYKLEANNQFIQLFSYDSSISTSGYMANNADYLIAKNLNILLKMSDSVGKNENLYTNNKIYTGLPASNSVIPPSEPFKDGIYLNLENFIKNEPADIGFKYEVKKKTENIVLDEARKDDSLYTKYNWGFCKNGEVYMRIGPSFSKLTRFEQSFELRAVELARFYLYNGFNQTDAIMLGVDAGLINILPSLILSDLASLLLPKDKYFARYENISAFKLDLKTGEVY
jgi:hypothetical protein